MTKRDNVILMERALGTPLPWTLSDRYRFSDFDLTRHKHAARDLLNRAYAGGGGDVMTTDQWWSNISSDDEFSVELLFVIEDQDAGEMAAIAHCWSSAFIKDFATAPNARARGLGRALMARIVDRFRETDAETLRLKVLRDNPTKALGFYERLEFRAVS